MSLQHAVLGVLEAREMSGYELTQFFESTARWVWTAPQSQIYPLLRSMEKDGLLAGEEQVRGVKLKRTSYTLTDAGREELTRWLGEVRPLPANRDAFLLQSLFLDMVEPRVAAEVLAAHIQQQRELIEQWSAHQARLLASDTPLLRERLQRREPDQHERMVRMKAHTFASLIDAASSRIEWAEEAARILGTEPVPAAAAPTAAPQPR